MRALSAIVPVLFGVLAVALFAPEAAAATVTATGAAASVGAVSAAALGAGIVVQLRAKQFGEDGTTTTQSFRLDSEGDDFATQLEAYGDAKAAEGAGPVRAELKAATEDRAAFQALAVDEVLRVNALNAGEGYDADEDRLFLESLPAKTLAVHFKRARAKGVSLSPQTTGEDPPAEAAEAAYGHVTVDG